MELSRTAVYDGTNVTIAAATDKHYFYYNSTAYDSGSIISDEDYEIIFKLIECGIIPAIGLLGMPANIINMAVFYRQGLKDKMNLCLFSLAFFDFMYLFFFFLTAIGCPAAALSARLVEDLIKWNVLRFTMSFRSAFLNSSGVLTAIIATERCICVVWPLKAATMFKTKTMAWLILGTVVVFNLLCLPYALKLVVRLKTDDTGKTTVVFDDTDLYINNKLAFLIVRDIILPGIGYVTFFVVSFVTVVTVRKLKTAMDWRQKTSSNDMDKRQLTLVKMLIIVSCVYIVCNVPTMALAFVRFLVDEFSTLGKYRNLFFVTHRLAFGVLMVNSSVNIIIYYKQSSKFQRELQASVCCFKAKRQE